MKPEEKARELVESFAETVPPITYGVLMERDWTTAKQCAIICVDEILDDFRKLLPSSRKYWQDVKEEIKKL